MKRLRCVRCGERAAHQWQVCADKNIYRPICLPCDVALNRMVLRWMNDPDWKIKADNYEKELLCPPR